MDKNFNSIEEIEDYILKQSCDAMWAVMERIRNDIIDLLNENVYRISEGEYKRTHDLLSLDKWQIYKPYIRGKGVYSTLIAPIHLTQNASKHQHGVSEDNYITSGYALLKFLTGEYTSGHLFGEENNNRHRYDFMKPYLEKLKNSKLSQYYTEECAKRGIPFEYGAKAVADGETLW